MQYQTCTEYNNKVDINSKVRNNFSLLNTIGIESDIKSNIVYLNKYISKDNKDFINNRYNFRNKLTHLTKHCYVLISKLEESLQQKYILYLFLLAFNKRSIRDKFGSGERCVSYYFLIELGKYYTYDTLNLLEELPNFGSWLDMNNIYAILWHDIYDDKFGDDSLRCSDNQNELSIKNQLLQKIIEIWIENLRMDEINSNQSVDSSELSLLAKWIPKENSSFSKKYKIDKIIAKKYFHELWEKDHRKAMRCYRKLISKLNMRINTTEIYMCNKDFKSIDYNLVPSKCLNIRSNVWLNINKNNKRKNPDDHDRTIARNNYLMYKYNKYNFNSLNACINNCYKDNSLQGLISLILEDLSLYENCIFFKTKNIAKYEFYESQIDKFINNLNIDDNELLKNSIFQINTLKTDTYSLSKAISIVLIGLSCKSQSDQYVITYQMIPEIIKLDLFNLMHHVLVFNDYNSIDSNDAFTERFYQNSNLSWIEKIQLIKLLKSEQKCNIVSTLDSISCYAIHHKKIMPKNIINISEYNSNYILGTEVNRLIDNNNIPLNYKGNRIDFDLKIYNNESIANINDFFRENHNTDIPKFILWNISDSINRSYKINLPFIQILDCYDKVMIDMLIKKSILTEDPWLQLEYILKSDYYISICNKFNNFDNNKLSVVGRRIL